MRAFGSTLPCQPMIKRGLDKERKLASSFAARLSGVIAVSTGVAFVGGVDGVVADKDDEDKDEDKDEDEDEVISADDAALEAKLSTTHSIDEQLAIFSTNSSKFGSSRAEGSSRDTKRGKEEEEEGDEEREEEEEEEEEREEEEEEEEEEEKE